MSKAGAEMAVQAMQRYLLKQGLLPDPRLHRAGLRDA
jgi:hypothetical protein